ncbi:MAG: biotin--[acetyl-CoA-carboxylase] ligase [Candidatus Omnitrophica bacterium CG07_land_8_20_14_0_80_42_15]|uniref:Bifunctional ligase/repressor BirA n=1 Tax=Candidatus Aquitaenariimonas noxiae TaxID=1974741 RepID=A0A2J0KYG3_9BACT|nr:MAG: biotin--[acetyl-CoA-carboxylase] ligase [Candidatus Omnitrophica bacterium CG07_land_8_20_14_0_80_42_15]
MDEEILKIFKSRPNEYISGEELSLSLEVSRTAIWKHIEKLRKDGYKIEAVPNLGYKLLSTPDKLLPEELKIGLNTKIIGKRIFSYASVDSTNAIAYKFAEDGFEEGTVVVAEAQTKGKGRLGRTWISPKEAGIYFSFILRPDILPSEVSKITLLSAVAVTKAIREVSGLNAVIRWPNDVLIDNKKVCGILTEMKAEQDKIDFMIIGIGINVNTQKADLPEEATSLKEEIGGDVQRIMLAKAVLEHFEHYYVLCMKKGFEPIINEWHKFSAMLGSRVKVICHDKEIQGQVQDIDESGALVIRLDNGLMERIFTGDVRFLR